MSVGQIIIVAALVGFALWLVASYNRLIALRGHLYNAFAQIDVQLRRRFDLIPTLVDSARAHLPQDRVTLEAVLTARNQAWNASREAARRPGDLAAMNALADATGLLADALGALMSVIECHPQLQSDPAMRRLAEELATTEDRIAFARQAYNDSVTDYNAAIGQFPVNLVASVFRMPPSQPLRSCECLIHQGSTRVQY